MYMYEREFDFLTESITYISGKDQHENTELVMCSESNDIWFHINNLPSAHLVAKINHLKLNKKELLKIVKQGALILKSISKYKSYDKLEICYTYISNVEVTDIPGTVNTSSLKIITV